MPSLEFLYNGLFWLLALGMVPFVQLILWKLDFRWVTVPIAALLLLPGVLELFTGFYFTYGETGELERWEVAYATTAPEAASKYIGMFVLFFLSFGLWLLVSQIPIKRRRNSDFRPRVVMKPFAILLGVFLIGCVYLSEYTTLQDAVERGDLEVTRSRLQFNFAGVGANDGAIFPFGTAGLRRFPLLPIAVETGNKEMVALLLAHGADIHSDHQDVDNFRGRVISRNVLYFAIKNEDKEMLEFLIASGADPTLGIGPAVWQRKKSLFEYLLENGANLDAARQQILPTLRERFEKEIEMLSDGVIPR